VINFTVPETNLLCIYGVQSREKTILNIMDSLTDIADFDMKKLAEDVIVKLDEMCDNDFYEWDFADEFADDYYDDE